MACVGLFLDSVNIKTSLQLFNCDFWSIILILFFWYEHCNSVFMLPRVLWVLILMMIFTSHHVSCIIIFVALRLIVPFSIFIPWGRCSRYSNTEAQRYTDTQREMLPLFEDLRLCRKNLAKKHSAKSLIPVLTSSPPMSAFMCRYCLSSDTYHK